MTSTAARRPIARTRYAFGQVPPPVLQAVAPAAEGFSLPIDRSTRANRENSRLMGELLGRDADGLDDVAWEDMRSMLAMLGLDADSIEMRAAAMTFPPGEKLNEHQREVAGLEPATIARRRELLDRSNKPDPAIAARDRMIAEERRRRGAGSITEAVPTDAPAPAPQKTMKTPIAVTPPLRPVQDADTRDAPEAERITAAPAQDPVEASTENGAGDDLSEADLLCLDALVMLRSGRCRKDIARHFGKNASTIWRWITRARQIERSRLNAVRPADVLGDLEETFQAKRADLEAQYAKALAAGSVRKIVELSREIRRWHVARFDVLHRSGTFRNYVHPAVMASSQDAERQSLHAMQ